MAKNIQTEANKAIETAKTPTANKRYILSYAPGSAFKLLSKSETYVRLAYVGSGSRVNKENVLWFKRADWDKAFNFDQSYVDLGNEAKAKTLFKTHKEGYAPYVKIEA